MFKRLFGGGKKAAPVEPTMERPRRKVGGQRFISAESTQWLSGWDTADWETINSRLWNNLDILRARARQAHRDSALASGFIQKTVRNVVGDGFVIKPRTGIPDIDDAVMRAVAHQSRDINFSTQGNMTRAMFERLVLFHLARDGECFVQRLRGYRKNDTGYALRIIDPALIFTQYVGGGHGSGSGNYSSGRSINQQTGNRIILGVEVDDDYRAVAYHLRGENPRATADIFTYYSGNITRLPAKDIIHLFLPTYAMQVRGIPWLHPVLTELEDLRRYHKIAIKAARQGAAKHFGISSPDGGGYAGDEGGQDDELVVDFTGDKVNQYPEGITPHFFDPKYPHEMYASFVDKINQLISTGLDVASAPLTNNWGGINFSAGQLMLHDDRDRWRGLQKFIANRLHAWWFDDWLRWAIMRGDIKTKDGIAVPLTAFDMMANPEWLGKQFAPVDAIKAAKAEEIAINNGTKSRAQIIRANGDDPSVVFGEIADEEKQFGKVAGKNMSADGDDDGDNKGDGDEDEG